MSFPSIRYRWFFLKQNQKQNRIEYYENAFLYPALRNFFTELYKSGNNQSNEYLFQFK